MQNVLLLETIADDALALLTNAENIKIFTAYGDTPLEKILAENTIHAVITRGKGQVNKALMDACPDLQVAARCGVGLDNVDVKEATLRKIKVVNAPGSNASTIAEHTISLMLMLQRNLYQSINEVKAGNWNWRNQFQGDELNGKTLGILGLGNIGKKVAKIADALGMNVIYWSRTEGDSAYKFATFEEVISQSDVISIHLPYLPETHHLIDEKAFSLMKPHVLLINTARGTIIDQDILFKKLENKSIAGFGADVLATEPPTPNDPLLTHPKALITAHVGSLTATTYTKMCVSTVNNVLAILSGKAPQTESVFNRNDL
ncbi:MAG: hydroxyacid dehydrogenase [Saprospiraceae bacterium]|nr:hydroxyacid dehydrogenase [Saprospiraceae bacterium]